jgi:hypothetical protein
LCRSNLKVPRSAAYRELVRGWRALAVLAAAALGAWPAPLALAQNSPPKPETDCGVTEMCLPSPAVTPRHQVSSSRLGELLTLAVVVVLLVVGSRLLLLRGPRETGHVPSDEGVTRT